MGWIYILVRTFPFWAIPIGIGLLTAAIRQKQGSKTKKLFYGTLGILFIGVSIYFLVMRGHVSAVPFVHQLIHGQR